NLEFWGVAALTFDIRQSKRLFGIIGAGDIPAKLIGYSVVPILLHYVSTENALYVSSFFILSSFFVCRNLDKAGKLDIEVKHVHHNKIKLEHGTTDLLGSFSLSDFFVNKLIKYLSILSFIIITIVTLINFGFYVEVKHHSHTDIELAGFISKFFALGRLLALLIRLVLTGRVMNRIGLKFSLLISPIILILILGYILINSLLSNNNSITSTLYLFGLAAVLSEMLKTSIQDPVFLSMMQPLSLQLRLKSHAVVKGVVDPFALVFSGIISFLFVHFTKGTSDEGLNIIALSGLIVVFIIVWILIIFLIENEYVRTLVKAISKRYSFGSELDITNERTKSVFLEKVKFGDQSEAMHTLNIVGKRFTPELSEIVLAGLENKNEIVIRESIALITHLKLINAVPLINKMINDESYLFILPDLIKSICLLTPENVDESEIYVNSDNIELSKSAIIGLMSSGGISAIVVAGQKLIEMINSPYTIIRKTAAEIIGDLKTNSFYKPILKLLNDEEFIVVKESIIACGKIKNKYLIEKVVKLFKDIKYEKICIDALINGGDNSVVEIKKILYINTLTQNQNQKLIYILGNINSSLSIKVLLEHLKFDKVNRYTILQALHITDFRVKEDNKLFFNDLIQESLNVATKITNMINFLSQTDGMHHLLDALVYELEKLREVLLLILSFIYDSNKIKKVRTAFHYNKKDTIANALEVFEIEVDKDISLRFIELFEPNDMKIKSLKFNDKSNSSYTENDIFQIIIYDEIYFFDRWTKAACTYSLNEYHGNNKNEYIDFLTLSSDNLIKETAMSIA
ncbi:MAG: hypothetical protein WAT89_02400, partial [Candidatus Kapaibacterium sp.]